MEKIGKLENTNKKIGIVVSRFNSTITENLLKGAIDALLQLKFKPSQFDVYRVPGSFEIPVILKNLLSTDKYDGYIVLSAVIRGDTPHFDFVASELTRGIGRLSLDSGRPISYGVITADSMEQAIDRAGGKMGNRGRDAALSLVETLSLLNGI